MKLDATKFGIAAGGAFAIIWVICSLFVFSMPVGMMNMSGHMSHTDWQGMQWHMGFGGLLIGLVAWTLVAGFTGWLIATLYNKQLD